MPRGGKRKGAGRKPKVSPEQARLISDNCDALFWIVWMQRYYQITDRAMPRLMDSNRLKTMQHLNVTREEMEMALRASDDDLEIVLGTERAEVWRDHVTDANYLARIDSGFLPGSIERLSAESANAIIDADAEHCDIYWTFTPSEQSIEAEVKHRAQRALANAGIDLSEKTIGRIWKRNYRLSE